MSKHSPATWSIRQSATHVTVVTASGDAAFHDDKRLPGVMEDARLIAAAPELLEALKAGKHLINVVRMPNAEYVADAHNAAVETIRAAIDKAEGGGV